MDVSIHKSCLDRHVIHQPDKMAIILRMSRAILPTPTVNCIMVGRQRPKALGISSGDRVIIYMGMVPGSRCYAGCARIGAGTGCVQPADALRDRIHDCQARLVITQDIDLGRSKNYKETTDVAVCRYALLKVLVTTDETRFSNGERMSMGQTGKRLVIVPPKSFHEHPLFILYTSGSTGTPRLFTSVVILRRLHTSNVFDLRQDGCVCG